MLSRGVTKMQQFSGRSGMFERLRQFLAAYKFYWMGSMLLVLLVFALLIIFGALAGSAKPFMYTFSH